jgi:hypothetical protein
MTNQELLCSFSARGRMLARHICSIGCVVVLGVALLMVMSETGFGQSGQTSGTAPQAASLPPGAPPLTPGAITLVPNTYKQDTVVFTLDPLEWFEYKYQMDKGATMIFSWKAPAKVGVEMHSEPADGPPRYAETFEKGEKGQSHGSYTAPFSGIHGWYWENLSEAPITITLHTAGFYRSAIEFRDRQRRTYELPDILRMSAYETK